MEKRIFRCQKCWRKRSLTTGTFLERSKLSLRMWYELVWCFALAHSARKASRLLGLNYKLCWQSYQTMRKSFVKHSLSQKKKITGTVEVDESFYGGLFKNLRKETHWKYRYEGKAKRGGAIYKKQPVFRIFKRNGEAYLELITRCSKPELQEIIKRKVKKKTEIFSDTFKSYHSLVGLGYIHSTVDHGMREWVLYLKEMEFRYNNRKLNFEQFVLKIIKILMSYNSNDFVPY